MLVKQITCFSKTNEDGCHAPPPSGEADQELEALQPKISPLWTDKIHAMLICTSLFLIIAGARLLVLEHYGTDLPWFDSWGVEGEGIYKPYFMHELSLGHFFLACNEHQIPFTKLLSLCLLLLNGLWDNQLQAVVNAVLYSFTGVAFYYVLSNGFSIAKKILIMIAVLLTFALPFGWENALWGFQTHFYLLIAFAIANIYIISIESDVNYSLLVIMAVLQFASILSLASGTLTIFAATATLIIILTRSRLDRKKIIFFAAQITIACVIVAVGIKMSPSYERGVSFSDFVNVFAHCASWPNIGSNVWFLLNWLPYALLVLLYLLRKIDDNFISRFVIGMGVWILGQDAAMAYSRNTLALISKYADIKSISIPINVMAIILLYSVIPKRWKKMIILFAVFWAAINSYYLYETTVDDIYGYLPARKLVFETQVQKTYNFLSTGNMGYLVPFRKYDIPHRDIEKYAALLTDPDLNKVLPRSININYQATMKPDAYLSRMSDFILRNSWLLLLAGGILFLAVIPFTMYWKKQQIVLPHI